MISKHFANLHAHVQFILWISSFVNIVLFFSAHKCFCLFVYILLTQSSSFRVTVCKGSLSLPLSIFSRFNLLVLKCLRLVFRVNNVMATSARFVNVTVAAFVDSFVCARVIFFLFSNLDLPLWMVSFMNFMTKSKIIFFSLSFRRLEEWTNKRGEKRREKRKRAYYVTWNLRPENEELEDSFQAEYTISTPTTALSSSKKRENEKRWTGDWGENGHNEIN